MEKKLNNLPIGSIVFWLGLIGIVVFVGLTIFMPAFSSYGAILANVSMGLLVLWLIDRYAFKEMDTQTELKNKNTAYALFWLGVCIIIAASIVAS